MPPYPNNSARDNEVFTEVAAARILWALGFAADHMYSARAANCIGCGSDPFKSNLKENRASIHDKPVAFNVVAIERLLPMEPIDPGDDETWSWADANALYANGWTREQKIAFDAYRLALGIVELPQRARLTEPAGLRRVEGRKRASTNLHAPRDPRAGSGIDVRKARHVRQLARRLQRLAGSANLRQRCPMRAEIPAQRGPDGHEGRAGRCCCSGSRGWIAIKSKRSSRRRGFRSWTKSRSIASATAAAAARTMPC